MIIPGLNACHGNSSACIVVGGKLIAAVEEERFTRIKHWAGMPIQSVNPTSWFFTPQGGKTANLAV